MVILEIFCFYIPVFTMQQQGGIWEVKPKFQPEYRLVKRGDMKMFS